MKIDRDAVENTDPLMQQQQPSHRFGKHRKQQADAHQRVNKRFAGQIGALGEPGRRQAEAAAEGQVTTE